MTVELFVITITVPYLVSQPDKPYLESYMTEMTVTYLFSQSVSLMTKELILTHHIELYMAAMTVTYLYSHSVSHMTEALIITTTLPRASARM